jgi:hypothetical protein
MSTPWKYISASVLGTSHGRTETPCQDSNGCRVFTTKNGSEVLVAVASDGAGSSKRSEEGSALACSLFLQEMEILLGSDGSGEVREISEEFVKNWLTSFQREVALRAEHEELKPRDFACTFIAAIVGHDCAAFAQIGDGAIIVPSPEEPDEYCYVFWPQQGEYANQTYFATDADAHEKIQYELVPHRVDEVAVLTDGIQGLALHYQSQTAHNPFFQPIFAWLRPAPEGYSDKFTASLAAYLNSPKVNESTDDDKTLVLATRRESSAIPPSSPPEQTTQEQGDAATALQ